MKIIFASNYYTHHQAPFSTAMSENNGIDFAFVETMSMEAERKEMGWEISKPDFVINMSNANEKEVKRLINDADVVIFGSIPYRLVRKRIWSRKTSFLYTERLYKTKPLLWKLPLRIAKYIIRYSHRNLFLLCSSAFSYYDFSKSFNFYNKAYKWGYFPELQRYNSIEELIEKKTPHSILWVARFIDWKHPETCIDLAKKLLNDGINDFKITMIGNGTMLKQIQKQIASEHLENNISVVGSMTPEEVRKYMENSEIFIFTSDRNEGWGAVLNEAMNSGCSVVASSEIGSVPYLIENGRNGLIYQDGNMEDLHKKVKELYFNVDKSKKLGLAAYHTIVDLWNADVAAERLVYLIDDLNKNGTSDRYHSGPCSKAEIIKDGWYK